MKRLFVILLLFVLINFSNNSNAEFSINEESSIPTIVTATYYHAVKSQCEGNHLITADGSFINKKKLKNGEIRWIAMSRDLLRSKKYKYGDKIFVYTDNKKLRGVWEIHDTMSKKHRNRIDFLVYDNEKPLLAPSKLTIKKI